MEMPPHVKCSKKLNELKQDGNAIIVFQDEVHFMTDSLQYPASGIPKGGSRNQNPTLTENLSSGFIVPGTGNLFVTKPDWFNCETTIGSICQFLSGYKVPKDKHLYIVMDNAPWHKMSKRLINNSGQYSDIRWAAIIVSLPLYSPNFNPIEQVWRITRREKT